MVSSTHWRLTLGEDVTPVGNMKSLRSSWCSPSGNKSKPSRSPPNFLQRKMSSILIEFVFFVVASVLLPLLNVSSMVVDSGISCPPQPTARTARLVAIQTNKRRLCCKRRSGNMLSELVRWQDCRVSRWPSLCLWLEEVKLLLPFTEAKATTAANQSNSSRRN